MLLIIDWVILIAWFVMGILTMVKMRKEHDKFFPEYLMIWVFTMLTQLQNILRIMAYGTRI